MIGGKVSDDVIDAIAFIEMHRQEAEKESGTVAACAQALPKLQELLDQLTAESTEPADVHAANVAAVTNDIARVKRFTGGGGYGGGKHSRPGQKKQAPRQHGQGQVHGQGQGQGQGGHAQGGQAHGGHAQGAGQGGGPASGQGPHHGRGPNQGQGRRRGRNKRRGGGGGGAGNAGGGAGGQRGAE